MKGVNKNKRTRKRKMIARSRYRCNLYNLRLKWVMNRSKNKMIVMGKMEIMRIMIKMGKINISRLRMKS